MISNGKARLFVLVAKEKSTFERSPFKLDSLSREQRKYRLSTELVRFGTFVP